MGRTEFIAAAESNPLLPLVRRRESVMEADIRLYLLQASPAAAVVVLAGGSNGCRLPPSPLPLSLSTGFSLASWRGKRSEVDFNGYHGG